MSQGKLGSINRMIGAALIGFGVVAASMPAGAQDAQPGGQPVTRAVSAVRACLCAQRAMSFLSQRVNEATPRYDNVRAQEAELSRQVEAARSRVNTENRAEIEAFSALLDRRDAAARASREAERHYAALVARYNGAVGYGNDVCGGRLFDPEEVESLKINLVCPRP